MTTCNDNIKVIGQVHIQQFRNGTVVDERLGPNLVVNGGKAAIASRINGDGAEPVFTYIGVGIGATGPFATDSALGTERDQDGASNTTHKLAVASRVMTTVANDTAQLVVTFNFTTGLAITETGVFNATPDGTMLARQVFLALNVASGDSIQVTWKIKVA